MSVTIQRPYLSVVVPAYNEETVLLETLKEVVHYLDQHEYSFEIIIVNDGSRDATLDIVTKYSTVDQRVRLISLLQNRGKGYALRQGFLAAKGEYILMLDADNAVSITALPTFVEEAEGGSAIVIASIGLPDAVIVDDNPKYRRLLGKVAKEIISLVMKLEPKDTQRGFKLLSAAAAEELAGKLTVDRWLFDVELLLLADRCGLSVKEVPVTWHNGPNSKVTLFSYFIALYELQRIKLNDWRGLYN